MSASFPRFRVPVSLRRLFPSASFVGCADIRTADPTERSTDVVRGSLFAAVPGTAASGIEFVKEAVERGAAGLLVERPVSDVSVPQCVVTHARPAFAQLCAAVAGSPTRRLTIAGTTGTNGKTTTTWLIRSILQAAGNKTGLLGTIEYSDGEHIENASLTTPDSQTFSNWLGAMCRRGATHAAVELSSHALDQGRTAGTALDAAVVTNITQDHFDYHGDFNAYRESKARIFEHLKPGGAVVLNLDDPGSRSLIDVAPTGNRTITFGVHGGSSSHTSFAAVTASIQTETTSGTRFQLTIEGRTVDVHSPLVGRHNVSNCLAAAAATAHMGVDADTIAAGIEQLAVVPGRLERVDCGQGFDVFVDYAHTDDALRRCVQSLKHLTAGRVFCVFGAGGDRDRTKRPLLANAAAAADVAVVTSDNPRTENPDHIIEEVLTGFTTGTAQYVEPDRRAAIQWAIEQARPGDCVVVAGKGHEAEQLVGTTRFPFDDREVAHSILKETHPKPNLRRSA